MSQYYDIYIYIYYIYKLYKYINKDKYDSEKREVGWREEVASSSIIVRPG